MLIRRDVYLDRLVKARGNGLVKVVTGIRRCGKSFLLFNLFHSWLVEHGVASDHIVEIALDDRRNKALRDPDAMLNHLDSVLRNDGSVYYVILDEVQMLDEFVDVLNSLLRIPNVDVYVTGSNSKFLSTDVITEFRGRGDQIRIHPLSFAEYLPASGKSVSEAWGEYLLYGGMPLVLSLDEPQEKMRYLRSLFDEVYLTDIVDRYSLRGSTEMDSLIDMLASSVGSLTNPTRIARTFASETGSGITEKTIRRYIEYLSDAFLISEAKRYDVKGRRYISSPSKYFFEDVGLRNARLNFRQIEENHLMEGVIYNELLARGYGVDVGVVDVYGKNVEGKTERKRLEIDFVVNRGSSRCYIQSALTIDAPDKAAQEKRPFRKVDDDFKKVIVVKDTLAPHYDSDGVRIIGITDFLLDRECLERDSGV